MCFDVYSRVEWSTVPFLGRPASPFIDEGEEQVTQRERERRAKEKKASRTIGSFFSFYAGPTDTADGDRDGSTRGVCSPLMPRPDVVNGL